MARICLAMILATPAMAFTPLVSAQQAPADSVQGRFNAAADLLNAGKADQALPLFEALEAHLLSTPKTSPTSLAIARFYKGAALLKLERIDAAKASTLLALEGSALDKPATKDIARQAREQFARVHERQMDDAGAAALYAQLTANAETDIQRIAYLTRQANLLSVLEPELALALSDKAIALAPALPKEAKAQRSAVHITRGRALMTMGRIKDARTAFAEGLSLYGTLDRRVDAMEYAMRADAAYAALRDGKAEEARKFMAYAGQGTSQKSPFPLPAEMPLPQCGGEDELKPDDMAIVEAGLLPNGTVSVARPIFATRGGRMAYAMASAVRDWRWQPNALTGINPVLLNRLRFELRCSMALPTTGVNDGRQALLNWLHVQEGGSLRIADPASKADAERLAREESSPFRAASRWLTISNRRDLNEGEMQKALAQAAAAAQKAGAPLEISALVRAISVSDTHRTYGLSAAARRSLVNVRPMLDEPEIRKDAAASARLGLFLAYLYGHAHMIQEEKAALELIVADTRLPEKHPLRTSALLGLANASALQGDTAKATESYAATGLSPRQCAALDQKPIRLKTNVSSQDFPMEAMSWGFTGWVKNEFDIDAEGKTVNIRPVASFPAGIFNAAGSGIVGDFVYRKSYRPDGSAGCTANTENVVFNIVR